MTPPRATEVLGRAAAPTPERRGWDDESTVLRSERGSTRGFAVALGVLVLVKVGLRTVGFRRTYRVFAATSPRPAGRGQSSASRGLEPARIAHVVSTAAAFLPWRALCLEQSLALCYLLRREGHDAVVRLGVRPYPFAAHAWVECDGAPLAESPEHLRPFAAFPPLPE